MNNRYLLQIMRRDENGKKYTDTSIVSAKQLCDFIEYLDLEVDVYDYEYRLISNKNFRLYHVFTASDTVSYETGAHYRTIYKGYKRYRNGEIIETKALDTVYYSSDH